MRSCSLPRPTLLEQALLELPIPARVRFNDRNAAKVPCGCPGPGGIAGRVHDVAEDYVLPALMAKSRIAA